jgi:hypothetical protein
VGIVAIAAGTHDHTDWSQDQTLQVIALRATARIDIDIFCIYIK